MNGVLHVFKPPGMTSHDVVMLVRKLGIAKKVGHTGTLDPGAAGVLLLCLGKATKISKYFQDLRKSYRAEITFGITTSTQDFYGNILEKKDASKLRKDQVIRALGSFTGEIEQVPPMTSAIKKNGKKLYELAREGKVVERSSRRVIIYSIELLQGWGWGSKHPAVLINVTCSKGTYIRTLCADIGHYIGCGAVMSFLLRTKVGPFDLESAWTIEDLVNACWSGNVREIIIEMNDALSYLPEVIVKPGAVKSVCSGGILYPPGVEHAPSGLEEKQIVRLCSIDELLALAEVRIDAVSDQKKFLFKPVRVLK